jgi:hypothetical protein
MKKLKLLLASVLVGVASVVLSAVPAHAATRLGGVSMAAACQNQWPGSEVALIANNAVSWKCRFWSSLGPVYYGIDTSKQCRVQYGSSAYAAYSNYNDPYSWSCYR